jgi:hypothetical protein
MKTRAEIDRLFDMYESFSKDYLLSIAKDAGKRLFNRIIGRRNHEYATDFLTVFCACLSELDVFKIEEYNLFKDSTGISNISFEQFQRMARLNGDLTTLIEIKTYSKTVGLDMSFDMDLMLLGLCICAIDGEISFLERDHMIKYVHMPNYTDDRNF